MPSRYRALWSTPGGGQGFSVFHCTDVGTDAAADLFADHIRNFFETIKGIFPDDVQINFDSEVTTMTETGVLTTVHPVSPPATVTGINTSPFNRAAGARVDWGTNTIVSGRRLSGRTFLVPCGSTVFDTTGVVTAGNVTAISTAAQNLINVTALEKPLRVWSRTHSVSDVVSNFSVPTKGAILRGRRD